MLSLYFSNSKICKEKSLKKKEYLHQIPRRLCYQNIIRNSAKSSFIIYFKFYYDTRDTSHDSESVTKTRRKFKRRRDAGKKTIDEKLSLFKSENQS